MNKRQQIVSWSVIAVAVLMVLFPPRLYVFVRSTTGQEIAWEFAGWWFIGDLSNTVPRNSGTESSPKHNDLPMEYWSIRIDTTRLVLQAVAMVVIAAGLFFQFRERKPKPIH